MRFGDATATDQTDARTVKLRPRRLIWQLGRGELTVWLGGCKGVIKFLFHRASFHEFHSLLEFCAQHRRIHDLLPDATNLRRKRPLGRTIASQAIRRSEERSAGR